jgi:PAS domain S-box-containing protein
MENSDELESGVLDADGSAEELYRTVVRAMSEGVVIHDSGGAILKANPAAERILGLSLAQMRGTSPLDPDWALFLPDGKAPTPDDIPSEITRRTGRPCRNVILGVRRGSGGLAWLSVSSESVPGPAGDRPRLVVATFADITPQLAAERELERSVAELRGAVERAETASKAKAAFLANMSHELRTPLNAILGFSEIIDKAMLGPVGNPKYREYVSDIHASARHLLEMIDDILDLSRIEAGKFDLSIEPLRIAEIWDPVVKMLASQATAKGLALEGPSVGNTVFLGDRRACVQVLTNLVGNAVKFTPPGGRIVVSVSLDDGDGRVTLSVADNGVGIAPALVSEMTKPFVQGKGSMTKGAGGAGLGLAICKSLVAAMHGELAIRSVVGKGTEVSVRLPAAESA